MLESETVNQFNFCLQEIVNESCILGKSYTTPQLVQKVLRFFPDRFDVKVTAIKESKDINTLELKALMGNLEPYDANRKSTEKAMSASSSDDDTSSKDEEDIFCDHTTFVVMTDEPNHGNLKYGVPKSQPNVQTPLSGIQTI